jgi:hypothetical protein
MISHEVTSTEPTDAAGDATVPAHALARIGDWLSTCADYHTASAMYEQLSGLSDAKLRRRGFTRENLTRDVCAACDPAGR